MPTPARIKCIAIDSPLLSEYVGQTADVLFGMPHGARGSFAVSARFTNGQVLTLDPGQYELLTGKIVVTAPCSVGGHGVAQEIRIGKADRRYLKHAQRGHTVSY